MSGKHVSRFGQTPEDQSVKRTYRCGPAAADRCIVCGELVDPFTKCVNLEPSNICLDCRMAPAEVVPSRTKAA